MGLAEIVERGDFDAIREALRDPSARDKLLRRIVSLLYSSDPGKKWRAVSALGVALGSGELDRDRVERQLQRFLWAMNDESGTVPYGIPEALGELLAVRPEFRQRILPLLISYLVEEELFQTGPILAGAIWAIGRAGIDEPEEKRRALPGLKAALGVGAAEVRGAALWTLSRLRLGAAAVLEIQACLQDRGSVCLLIDEEVREIGIADLAQRALESSSPASPPRG